MATFKIQYFATAIMEQDVVADSIEQVKELFLDGEIDIDDGDFLELDTMQSEHSNMGLDVTKAA